MATEVFAWVCVVCFLFWTFINKMTIILSAHLTWRVVVRFLVLENPMACARNEVKGTTINPETKMHWMIDVMSFVWSIASWALSCSLLTKNSYICTIFSFTKGSFVTTFSCQRCCSSPLSLNSCAISTVHTFGLTLTIPTKVGGEGGSDQSLFTNSRSSSSSSSLEIQFVSSEA